MIESKFGWRKEDSSVEPNIPAKDIPDDKSKAAPAADQPAKQPDRAPAEAAPAPKSQQSKRRRPGLLRARSIGQQGRQPGVIR